MKRVKLALLLATAWWCFPEVARATNSVPALPDLLCADTLQNETLKYVSAVQEAIRLSIKANLSGKGSPCANGLSCIGGVLDSAPCTTNTDCGVISGQCNGRTCNSGPRIGEDCIADSECMVEPSECSIDTRKNVASKFAMAKAKLEEHVARKCVDANLANLGFPRSRGPSLTNSWCQDTSPTHVAGLVDCILRGSVGDLIDAIQVTDAMARAATPLVPDSLIVPGSSEFCGVNLGDTLENGYSNAVPSTAYLGGTTSPATISSCSSGVCVTADKGEPGNILAITSNFGSLNTCYVTRTVVTGTGTIDLSGSHPGLQTRSSAISTEIIIGRLCPECIAGLLFDACAANPNDPFSDGGPNNGKLCNNPGEDPACPPTLPANVPVVYVPFNLTTESVSLSTPANNPSGGATNPNLAFCGSCDSDETVGCQNDQDCVNQGDCMAGFGNGCCQFANTKGAFGDITVTSLKSIGKRGPYMSKLTGISCVGKTSSVVDSVIGLPGPSELTALYLNTFVY